MNLQNKHCRASGFTLVEILVVIAVIAILAAMLFPVFARARENARRTSCLSNLKQIGLGVAQYQQDYDEYFPLGTQEDWNNGWPTTVQPYINSIQVFRCPNDDANVLAPDWIVDVAADGTVSYWAGVPISYAANGYMTCTGNCDSADAGRLLGVMQMVQEGAVVDGAWWIKDNPRHLSQIQNPAQTILLSEKHNRDSAQANGFSVVSSFGPNLLFTGVSDWEFYGPGAIPDGTRAAANYPNGPAGSVSANHLETANFLFCDGHAKAMHPAATNPDPLNRPQENMWNSMR